jgi:hypothetical protein
MRLVFFLSFFSVLLAGCQAAPMRSSSAGSLTTTPHRMPASDNWADFKPIRDQALRDVADLHLEFDEGNTAVCLVRPAFSFSYTKLALVIPTKYRDQGGRTVDVTTQLVSYKGGQPHPVQVLQVSSMGDDFWYRFAEPQETGAYTIGFSRDDYTQMWVDDPGGSRTGLRCFGAQPLKPVP